MFYNIVTDEVNIEHYENESGMSWEKSKYQQNDDALLRSKIEDYIRTIERNS